MVTATRTSKMHVFVHFFAVTARLRHAENVCFTKWRKNANSLFKRLSPRRRRRWIRFKVPIITTSNCEVTFNRPAVFWGKYGGTSHNSEASEMHRPWTYLWLYYYAQTLDQEAGGECAPKNHLGKLRDAIACSVQSSVAVAPYRH